MARMLKLLHAVPELLVLIKAMMVALRAVSCTVGLMLSIVFVFGVTFRQLTEGTDVGEEFFPNVLFAMRFLLVQGTMPDMYDIIVPLCDESLFLGFIFLSSYS